MKKIFTTVIIAIMLCIPALAQKTVEATDDFTSYNRNSISIVTLNYNDQYDEFFTQLVNNFNVGYKFDINKIKTTSIALNGTRTASSEVEVTPIDNTTWAPESATAKEEATAAGMFDKILGQMLTNIGPKVQVNEEIVNKVLAHLNENNVGKQIFDYVLAPNENGVFSRTILDERGLWNATDTEFNDAQMMQVNTLGQDGETLLKNSYIVVYDMKNPVKTEVTSKDKEGNEYVSYNWNADVCAYVFAIANAQEVIDNILNNMWIYNTDDNASQVAKRQAYNDLKVELELVTAVGVNKSAEYLDEAMETVYEDLLTRLEQNIEKWQVTLDCQTVRPYITANAGIKEGIRNAQRYAIYKQVYNKETKSVELKRQGYARATEVADNAKVADGQSDTSYFYRISGMSILKGQEIMKQSNDLRMGFHANFNISAFSTVDFGIDYLAFIQRNGMSHYGLVNFGYDMGLFNENEDTFANVSLGYMFGLKLKTLLEIQPFATAAIDVVGDALLTDEDIDVMDYAAYFANVGARVVLNTFYPFQVYAQGSFSLKLAEGDYYYIYGADRIGGIGFGAGFRYCF